MVLVHGLWMRPVVMRPLARRLRRAGLCPALYGYPSRRESIAAHAARLDHWLAQRFSPGEPLAFVGHSLGGVVLRALAARRAAWFEGARTVMLGTPNRGTMGGARLLDRGAGRWWLGVAGRELARGTQAALPVPPGAVGVIAGTRRRWCTRSLVTGANDGLVAVAETELEGAGLRTFRVGHTGLLLHRGVAEATAYFLVNGRFDGHGEPPRGLC